MAARKAATRLGLVGTSGQGQKEPEQRTRGGRFAAKGGRQWRKADRQAGRQTRRESRLTAPSLASVSPRPGGRDSQAWDPEATIGSAWVPACPPGQLEEGAWATIDQTCFCSFHLLIPTRGVVSEVLCCPQSCASVTWEAGGAGVHWEKVIQPQVGFGRQFKCQKAHK